MLLEEIRYREEKVAIFMHAIFILITMTVYSPGLDREGSNHRLSAYQENNEIDNDF
jgi:hypothetical protein